MKIFILLLSWTMLFAEEFVILEKPNKRVTYTKAPSGNERSLTGQEIYYPNNNRSNPKIATGKLIVSFDTKVDNAYIEQFMNSYGLSDAELLNDLFNTWVFESNGEVLKKASQIGTLDNIRYATPDWVSKRVIR